MALQYNYTTISSFIDHRGCHPSIYLFALVEFAELQMREPQEDVATLS